MASALRLRWDRFADALEALEGAYSVYAPVLADGHRVVGPCRRSADLAVRAGCTLDPTPRCPAEHRSVPPLFLALPPCDARAMAAWGGERPFVLALACQRPAPTCFCTLVGGDPCGPTGADALLVDLDDRLLLEACTPRGHAVLRRLEALTSPADPEDARAAALQGRAIRGAMPAPVSGVSPDPQPFLFLTGGAGAAMAERCVDCAACLRVCPVVRGRADHQLRGRVLDAVVLRRLRRTLGARACVGCGRCIRACPVNNDPREVLWTA